MVCLVVSSFKKPAVTMANRDAKTMAMKVLKNREGQKVGLKKPLQKLPFSSQAPGVSMKSMMPVTMNSDIQAQIK